MSKKTQLAYTVMGMIFPYKAILGDRNMNIEIFGTAERMKALATLALDFISGHAVLLPVPSTKDGTHISGTDITLDQTLGAVGGESVVVGYNLPLWYKEKAEGLGARILDLSLDEKFMKAALKEAQKAALEDEVPVGCVIVRNGEIVGRGRNRRETAKTALGHAEIEAIADACKNLGGWRLWECTLYVTLEPCPMCAGAIINARIPRVVYGASDKKCGATGSVCNLFSMAFNHHPQVEKGLLEEESSALLQEFFQKLRLELRSRPKWGKGITRE